MNAFDQVDALLVIDMQNSFLHVEGTMRTHRGRSLTDIDGVIDRNAQLVKTAREHTLPVILTRHCYRPGYVDAGGRALRLFESMSADPLVSGSWDAAIIDELAAGSHDVVVNKTRMDAFQGTDLEVVLGGLSASRLLITGIVTNACVETTARSAAMRDYDVTVLADCCTTYSSEHQANALEALEYYAFARVDTLAGMTASA
jgi:nicotinamidase-related amidase